MMIRAQVRYFLVVLFISFHLFSSAQYEDSVLAVIKKTESDSTNVISYLQIAYYFDNIHDSTNVEKYINKAYSKAGKDYYSNFVCNRNKGILLRNNYKYKEAIALFKENVETTTKNKDTLSLAKSYNDLALTLYYDTKYDSARAIFETAAPLFEKMGDMIGAGQSYNNAGIMCEIDNDLKQAIEYYYKAIHIYEDAKNYVYLIGTTQNVGLILLRQEKFKEAIEFFNDNMHYLDSINDPGIVTDYYLNTGIAYDDDGQLEKAYDYFKKSYDLAIKNNFIKRQATALTNLASNSNYQGKLDEAIKYNLEALKIKTKLGNKSSIAISQIGIGDAYSTKKEYTKAIRYYQEALKNAKETNYKEYLTQAYKGLSYAYYQTGNFKKAYDYKDLQDVLKDSLNNVENNKIIESIRTKYETEKKEQQIQLQASEIEKQKLNVSKEKAINAKKTAQRNLFIFGFLLMIVLAVVILYFLRQKQRSNKLLKTQKQEISEKNEELYQQNEEILTQRDKIQEQKERLEVVHLEITQSIDYAKRLQESVLPANNILDEHFTDNLIIFMPKDVVSGDFYWWTYVKVDDTMVITVADCTGHGVPGAFMSMLGISFLREIVTKEYITHPGVILRKLRKEIVKSLKQKGEEGEQKDGMDMTLVSINTKTLELQYAGANNPLYLITDNQLEITNEKIIKVDNLEFDINNSKFFYEVKADKMPIAIYDKMDPFYNHKIQVNKGDIIYLFSDGFADQFGGPKNKKFKYKSFKQLLLDNAEKPMPEQKEILKKAFSDWKGIYEQVDDITVLGIKI